MKKPSEVNFKRLFQYKINFYTKFYVVQPYEMV